MRKAIKHTVMLEEWGSYSALDSMNVDSFSDSEEALILRDSLRLEMNKTGYIERGESSFNKVVVVTEWQD